MTHSREHSPRWLLPLLVILFFGSGVCALIYPSSFEPETWIGGPPRRAAVPASGR